MCMLNERVLQSKREKHWTRAHGQLHEHQTPMAALL